MKVANKTFQPQNTNTYRSYFPAQAGSDDLKDGFEISPVNPLPQNLDSHNLGEANVWPHDYEAKVKFETLHQKLQALSEKLHSLLGMALGKEPSFSDPYLDDSISTLRLYTTKRSDVSPTAGVLLHPAHRLRHPNAATPRRDRRTGSP